MNIRISLAIVIAFLLYAGYSWYTIPQYDGFDINPPELQNALQPAIRTPPSPTAAGGPNTPGQRAPNESIVIPSERPFDPEEKSYESSELPERLRHPERLYGPGLEQDDSVTAVESGIASESHQQTMNAYQTFGPEFAQNGGSFMENGVVANDTFLSSDYSSV